jgi:hypothetical protein
MTVVLWNPKVNKRLFINGDYAYDGEYIKEIRMASGKPRVYLLNEYAPKEFGNVGLDLDDREIIADGKYNTEKKQFEYWFEYALRYGSLPFQIPRIFYPQENGIYQFIPNSLSFEGTGFVTASFGLREIQ